MRAVLWLISLSLVPSMALETFQFYQARLCQEDTQMCYAMKILVHQTCAKSDTLSVYLIHLYLNVTLPQVFFKHFASKNQLPGFYISGTLVENRLILEAKFGDNPYLIVEIVVVIFRPFTRVTF